VLTWLERDTVPLQHGVSSHARPAVISLAGGCFRPSGDDEDEEDRREHVTKTSHQLEQRQLSALASHTSHAARSTYLWALTKRPHGLRRVWALPVPIGIGCLHCSASGAGLLELRLVCQRVYVSPSPP